MRWYFSFIYFTYYCFWKFTREHFRENISLDWYLNGVINWALTSLPFIWSWISSPCFPFKKRCIKKESRENLERTPKFLTQECTQFQANSVEIIFLFVHLVRGSVKMQLNSECYIIRKSTFRYPRACLFAEVFRLRYFSHVNSPLFY